MIAARRWTSRGRGCRGAGRVVRSSSGLLRLLDDIRANPSVRLWGDRLMIAEGPRRAASAASSAAWCFMAARRRGRGGDWLRRRGGFAGPRVRERGHRGDGGVGALQPGCEAVTATTLPWHTAWVRVLQRAGLRLQVGWRNHELLRRRAGVDAARRRNFSRFLRAPGRSRRRWAAEGAVSRPSDGRVGCWPRRDRVGHGSLRGCRGARRSACRRRAIRVTARAAGAAARVGVATRGAGCGGSVGASAGVGADGAGAGAGVARAVGAAGGACRAAVGRGAGRGGRARACGCPSMATASRTPRPSAQEARGEADARRVSVTTLRRAVFTSAGGPPDARKSAAVCGRRSGSFASASATGWTHLHRNGRLGHHLPQPRRHHLNVVGHHHHRVVFGKRRVVI